MKLYYLASLLMTAQVMSSPRPQGWSAPPAGWTAAPPPATPDGLTIAAGETLIGQDIAVENDMGDSVEFNVTDDGGTATVDLSTELDPDSYLGAYLGEVQIPGVAESEEGVTVNLYSYGSDTGVYNLTGVYSANVTSNPTALSANSLDSFAGSSWVQYTDGINVANGGGSGGSGWKQDEGVKQN